MLKCIIIDDEPLAREGLTIYADRLDFLEVVGICENALTLADLVRQTRADLLLLDIQMPGLSGIDYLRSAPVAPMAIITTAYPDYALEGYQLNVLDYLLKPVTFERFFQAAGKAREYHSLRSAVGSDKIAAAEDYFFIRCGNKYEKIVFEEIVYIAAMQNYVSIVTRTERFMTLLSMKHLEETLDPRKFLRIHKSYIVSRKNIKVIENNELTLTSSVRLPIGKIYRQQVLDDVVSSKLWHR